MASACWRGPSSDDWDTYIGGVPEVATCADWNRWSTTWVLPPTLAMPAPPALWFQNPVAAADLLERLAHLFPEMVWNAIDGYLARVEGAPLPQLHALLRLCIEQGNTAAVSALIDYAMEKFGSSRRPSRSWTTSSPSSPRRTPPHPASTSTRRAQPPRRPPPLGSVDGLRALTRNGGSVA